MHDELQGFSFGSFVSVWIFQNREELLGLSCHALDDLEPARHFGLQPLLSKFDGVIRKLETV